jgi:predicted permease
LSGRLIDLLLLFLNNLLPIFLAAGAGYLLSRYSQANPRTFSQAVFYIFSPCLVFTLLTTSQLSDGAIVNTMLSTGIEILLIGLITWLVGKALRISRREMAAVVLVAMFMNSGNYGLPVVLFAFGDTALSYASLFFVTNAILAYSLGVVIISMGSASFSQAVKNLLKVPLVYALGVALFFMRTGWEIPQFVSRTVTLLGNASIPGMLVLLGMQLHKANWAGKGKPLAVATVMRLLVAPVLMLLLARVFAISGPARQASVLQAGMPTAVLTTMLATEFEVEPALVTATVFLTTLLSPITLTPLLAFLGA